jgi:hypothetical protein
VRSRRLDTRDRSALKKANFGNLAWSFTVERVKFG